MSAPPHYRPRYAVAPGDGPRNDRWPTVDGMTNEPDYGVVVIGAGGAGLAAAVSAAEAGASARIFGLIAGRSAAAACQAVAAGVTE